MRETTILYLYYNNPDAFSHLENMGLNQHKIKKVFVDDGSNPKLVPSSSWINTDVLRIDEDIPWNNPKANNVGFDHIAKGRVIRLDIDHWFELSDLDKLMAIDIPPKTIIKFKRIAHYQDRPNAIIGSGKNIYIANLEEIIALGGYNEDFCGNYGYEDGELFHRIRKNDFRIIIHQDIHCHTNVHHHTKKLNRDTSINIAKFAKWIK